MASYLDNLESTVGGWYKGVPHLPKNGQKWLADNVWWLALVGAILSIFALLVLIPALFAAMSLTATVSTLTAAYAPTYSAYAGVSWVGALVSIAGLAATAVILFAAYSPLKAGKKKGWSLLFLSTIVNLAFAVVSDIVSFQIGGIIGAAIGAAISGYFLFEIHSYFVTKTKSHDKADAKK